MKLQPDDLNKIRDKMKAVSSLRDGAGEARITMHMGTCGIASGARDILTAFMDLLDKSGRSDIILTTSGCAGLCSSEPMVTVERKGEAPVKYAQLTREKAEQIFNDHVVGGTIVKELALAIGNERVS